MARHCMLSFVARSNMLSLDPRFHLKLWQGPLRSAANGNCLMRYCRRWSLMFFTGSPVPSEVKGKPGGNPEPGDRLRFVFVFVSCVACVRAGEAKLRVRARCRVFLLGRPRLWEVVLLRSRPICEAQDVVYTWVLRPNGSKSVSRGAHRVCFTWVL